MRVMCLIIAGFFDLSFGITLFFEVQTSSSKSLPLSLSISHTQNAQPPEPPGPAPLQPSFPFQFLYLQAPPPPHPASSNARHLGLCAPMARRDHRLHHSLGTNWVSTPLPRHGHLHSLPCCSQPSLLAFRLRQSWPWCFPFFPLLSRLEVRLRLQPEA